MTYPRKHLSPRAFTLIEILVVLGILAVLLGIAVVGFRTLNKSATTRKSKMVLSNAASVLAEYDAATSLKQQPNMMWNPGNPAGTKELTGFDIWKDADPGTNLQQALAAPPASVDADNQNRLKYQAVLNTAVVLRVAGMMPNAKRVMSQLPAESLVNVVDPATNPPVTIGPVMLDGWGNPIIFVPASGLTNVYIGAADDAAMHVVRSNKVHKGTDTTGLATIPPSARPFFASAGPDGFFGFVDKDGDGVYDPPSGPGANDGDAPAGDDNIYSFEN